MPDWFWALPFMLSFGCLLLGRKAKVSIEPQSHVNNGRMRSALREPRVYRDDETMALYCPLGVHSGKPFDLAVLRKRPGAGQ